MQLLLNGQRNGQQEVVTQGGAGEGGKRSAAGGSICCASSSDIDTFTVLAVRDMFMKCSMAQSRLCQNGMPQTPAHRQTELSKTSSRANAFLPYMSM